MGSISKRSQGVGLSMAFHEEVIVHCLIFGATKEGCQGAPWVSMRRLGESEGPICWSLFAINVQYKLIDYIYGDSRRIRRRGWYVFRLEIPIMVKSSLSDFLVCFAKVIPGQKLDLGDYYCFKMSFVRVVAE